MPPPPLSFLERHSAISIARQRRHHFFSTSPDKHTGRRVFVIGLRRRAIRRHRRHELRQDACCCDIASAIASQDFRPRPHFTFPFTPPLPGKNTFTARQMFAFRVIIADIFDSSVTPFEQARSQAPPDKPSAAMRRTSNDDATPRTRIGQSSWVARILAVAYSQWRRSLASAGDARARYHGKVGHQFSQLPDEVWSRRLISGKTCACRHASCCAFDEARHRRQDHIIAFRHAAQRRRP